MYVIIVGAGEVGFNIAQRLSEERHDVVVVDARDSALDRCRDRLDCLTVCGSGSHESVLVEAGVERARLLLAVTDTDEVNIVACLIARAYGVPHRIARVTEAVPSERKGGKIAVTDLGVTQIINPNEETIREVINLLQYSAASDVVEYASGRLALVRVEARPGAPIAGRQLRELTRDERDRHWVIVAIQRDGKTIVPHGDDVVKAGDRLLAMCRRESVRDIDFLTGHREEKIRRVMIMGGGDLGLALARELERMKCSVVIIERDRAACSRLNDVLDRTLVLHGDGTDISLLRSEGVSEMDAFVALTADEENNILSALMAKHHGCRRVITLIRRPDYVSVMPTIGIDAAVSKRKATVSGVLRFVRRGSILSVALFADTDAEALELRATKGSVMVGTPLRNIRFPRRALVGAVIREGSPSGEVEIASGSTVIEPGDRVIVFALRDVVAKVGELLG